MNVKDSTIPFLLPVIIIVLLLVNYCICENVILPQGYAEKISLVVDNCRSCIIDSNGIPIVNYSIIKDTNIGLQRNPVTIAQFALRLFELYDATGDVTLKDIFINNSNWLVENSIAKWSYSIYEYNFPWPPYNLSVPWHSAMAQSIAIQVMIKAHQLTGGTKYIDTAKRLLNAFFVDVTNGGVTYKYNNESVAGRDQGWWYEEYAHGDGVEKEGPKVLNGMIIALLGIHDYYDYTKEPEAKYLFDRGVSALKNSFHTYDHNQTYSAYDKFGGYAPYNYHKLHVRLLDALYNITNDQFFKKYHDAWGKFVTPP